MSDYVKYMKTKENEVQDYIYKAQQEQRKNGCATKAQCVYLQEAAKLRGEMARVSTGAEREHQLALQQELNGMIRRLVEEIRQGGDKSAAENNAAPAGGSESDNGPDSISDETVKKWFKSREELSHGFEAVDGMSETVERMKECVAETEHAGLRSYLKMSNTHGFLLFGPPGCGKTFLATAFASELMQDGWKYMQLDGADILSKYVGEAESTVKRVFQEAKKNAPCLVFIDEIDSVCKNRSLPGLPEYASSITTAFLNGYNSIADRSGDNAEKTIVFICATNYPNLVDDAMVDRLELVRIPLPDAPARAKAFEGKLEGIIQLEEGFGCEDMAAVTEGYNRRDIDRLIRNLMNLLLKHFDSYSDEEAVYALRSGSFRLDKELFTQALNATIASPKDNILREQEEWEKRLKKTGEDAPELPEEPDTQMTLL